MAKAQCFRFFFFFFGCWFIVLRQGVPMLHITLLRDVARRGGVIVFQVPPRLPPPFTVFTRRESERMATSHILTVAALIA